MVTTAKFQDRSVISAVIVLFPGFALSTVAGFTDLFPMSVNQPDLGDEIRIDWEIASASHEFASANSGLTVQPTIALDDVLDPDFLVLCGGRSTELDHIRPELWRLLHVENRASKVIVGLSVDPCIFVASGLLSGDAIDLPDQNSHKLADGLRKGLHAAQNPFWMNRNVFLCPDGALSPSAAVDLILRWKNLDRAISSQQQASSGKICPRVHYPTWRYQEEFKQASSLTRNAIQLMESNVSDPFSVSKLAKQLATTRASLTRLFKREMGTAPGDFWLSMRLEIASQLLAGGSQTVTEVAHDLGFADTAHFCRKFKEKFAQTPGAYRKGSFPTI